MYFSFSALITHSVRIISSDYNGVILSMFPKLSSDNILIFIAGMLCGMLVFIITFIISLFALQTG